MYKVLDLFSGIGGFSLGLERTGGFNTIAFCEICPKARKVLSKHWPNVKQYEDIRGLNNEQLIADGIEADVITGGFPCQDISCAGKGKGIKAERSGLWAEMFRLIRDVRPAWAIIENVSALRSKGLALVLQNISEIGYMCEWHCIPASAVGAPHQRDRIWIVANANDSRDRSPQRGDMPKVGQEIHEGQDGHSQPEPSGYCEDVANAMRKGLEGKAGQRIQAGTRRANETESAKSTGCGWSEQDQWAIEPNVGRVAHGVPGRVDRLKQLGNSVVPQIPELIGRAILEVA